MNIVIFHNFAPHILDKLRAELPADSVRQFAHVHEAPPDVLAEADVIYAGIFLDELAASSAPRVKWVQSNYAGVDFLVDHPLFAARDVLLTSASGVHAPSMSQFGLMAILALAHRLPLAMKMMREGKWREDRPAFTPIELSDATVGIVGYGAIGEAIAARCLGLGARVIATTSSRAVAVDSRVAVFERERLDELLAQSDFVVLTVPHTPATRALIGAQRLARMKPTAYLINVSRGEVVDEAALVAALREGRIAGAALDVFGQEPLPDDSPLWQLDNVILTPHVAGVSGHYQDRVSDLFIANARRFAKGERLTNAVDFERGY